MSEKMLVEIEEFYVYGLGHTLLIRISDNIAKVLNLNKGDVVELTITKRTEE